MLDTLGILSSKEKKPF